MKTGFFFQKHGGGISKYIFRGRKGCGLFFEFLEICCGKIGQKRFFGGRWFDLPNRCRKRCEGEGERERERREREKVKTRCRHTQSDPEQPRAVSNIRTFHDSMRSGKAFLGLSVYGNVRRKWVFCHAMKSTFLSNKFQIVSHKSCEKNPKKKKIARFFFSGNRGEEPAARKAWTRRWSQRGTWQTLPPGPCRHGWKAPRGRLVFENEV